MGGGRSVSKLHSGPVAQLGCMAFSFGYRSAGPRSIWCALDGPPDYLGPPDYTVLGLFGAH